MTSIICLQTQSLVDFCHSNPVRLIIRTGRDFNLTSMKNYKITSLIQVSRKEKQRLAVFTVTKQGVPKEFLISVTGDSLQHVLAIISKKYNTILYADDYKVNYPLRKDEFIPNPKNRPEVKPCSVPDCKNDSNFEKDEKPLCASHFYASERTMPVRRTQNKLHRNAPCPCGSNRKYKNCCSLKIEHKSGRLYYQPQNK